MKTKFSGILTLLLAFVVHISFAQEKTISGTVSDEDGLPLPGVNIIVKGTSNGTQSDFDGNYSINASVGDVLTYSYVGQKTVERTVGSANSINVTMQEDAGVLDEVVITAQGIKKEKKALGYAVATISSDQIASKPSTDVARALTGKAPGVNITQTSGLSGSGTNIIIRGYSSINGSNQPLFVVDGVPFNSDTNTDRSFVQGGAAASSRFLDLDPNNIQEISVLKGLSATTLYGQAGRNGVILVTTKSGSSSDANKKFEISFSQSNFFNEIANLPDYQDEYGNGFYQNYSQAFSNWGPRFQGANPSQFGGNFLGISDNGYVLVPHPYTQTNFSEAFPEFAGQSYEYRPYDSVEQFFDTGNVVTTSVGVNGSNGSTTYAVNAGRTVDEGFIDGNVYKRFNLSAGGSSKLSNNFTVSSSFNYANTERDTPPTAVGFGSNPAGASVFANILYTPRSVDLFGLPFENPLTNESVYYRAGNDIQNPRWTLKNIKDTESVRRFFGNVQAVYQINDWLNASYRLSLDSYSQHSERRANRGGVQIVGGQFRTTNFFNSVWDHTFSLNFDKDLNDDFNLNGTIGFNPRRETADFDTTISTQQFIYNNFTHGNFEEQTAGSGTTRQNIVGAYASATLGYKDFLYLTAAARNDWVSNLQPDTRSLFYPSASVSFIPTSAFESLKGNNTLNYLKLRFGYGSSAGFPTGYPTVIGLNTGANVFINPFDEGVVNTLSISNVLGNEDLRPELVTELELGIETRLFNNRVGLDLSVYDKRTNDLIIQTKPLDPATGTTVTSDNIGEISNKGLELGFNATLIKPSNDDGFRWDVSGQYTINENIVEDNGSAPGSITVIAGFGNQGNAAISGEAFGVIVGSSIQRNANGDFVVGADGNYVVNNDLSIIGDPNADWRTTVINEFSYKNFTLSGQIEYTHGGDIFSTTASALLSRGLTTDTAFDRSQTYVLPGVTTNGEPNTTQIAATDVGFVNSGFFIDEQAVYDASTIRLREISLSYNFPAKLLEKTPFGKASITFSGQNLWFKAINFPEGLNFDPEITSLGVGNGQGFDYLTGPTAKRYGFSLNLTF